MNSVRFRLTLSILAAILISWVLSGITSYLVVRENYQALRRQMLANPAAYPRPLPAPRFHLLDILVGAQQMLPREPPRLNPPPRGDGQPRPEAVPPTPPPLEPAPPRAERNRMFALGMLFIRGGIALLLALGIGALLSKRFTDPLTALADGAKAFQRRNMAHRIARTGDDEFAQVAAAMNAMAAQVDADLRALAQDAHRRRHLLADVAHELRGPVTTLRTMAGALAEGVADDPARRARAVAALVRTADRLLHLVTDLLELARLDLRELPLHPQPVDVYELAHSCVAAHAAAAQQAQIRLHALPPGPPVMATADPDRLAQVIDNLLDNAISYAGPGAELRVRVEPGAPLRLLVADTGRGIAAEHLPYVFDPFYRADRARTPGDRHSGLGLRIARGLIEAHGGTLALHSAEGTGTTAVITLPATEDAHAQTH